MAYIQEIVKGKKIVSFKIKACLGRDANGKQLFKCTTWYPPADLTPAKARKEVQKVAAVWEEEVRQNYIKEQEARAVAGELPAPAPVSIFMRSRSRSANPKEERCPFARRRVPFTVLYEFFRRLLAPLCRI